MIFSKANFGTFSTSFVIQACGAVTGILTARLLGAVARGELATVILWPTILSNLGLMGCNWVLAREVAKEPEREGDWAAMGIAVGLATSLLYLLAGYFLIPLLLPSDRGYLLPVARLCLLLIPLDIFNQVLLAVEHGRMRGAATISCGFPFSLFYLLLIGFIAATRSGSGALVRFRISSRVNSWLFLVRLWIQRKSLATGNPRFDGMPPSGESGGALFRATISNLVSLQFDTILVISLLNTEAAGIYAVAAAFANGQSSLGDALGITSFAVLSNEKNAGGQKKIHHRNVSAVRIDFIWGGSGPVLPDSVSCRAAFWVRILVLPFGRPWFWPWQLPFCRSGEHLESGITWCRAPSRRLRPSITRNRCHGAGGAVSPAAIRASWEWLSPY